MKLLAKGTSHTTADFTGGLVVQLETGWSGKRTLPQNRLLPNCHIVISGPLAKVREVAYYVRYGIAEIKLI